MSASRTSQEIGLFCLLASCSSCCNRDDGREKLPTKLAIAYLVRVAALRHTESSSPAPEGGLWHVQLQLWLAPADFGVAQLESYRGRGEGSSRRSASHRKPIQRRGFRVRCSQIHPVNGPRAGLVNHASLTSSSPMSGANCCIHVSKGLGERDRPPLARGSRLDSTAMW